MLQIDPNGLCNSGCWFCPVSYKENPEVGRKDMPIEMFEDILIQLTKGKGDFVSDTFDFIYTAHYNEVLLYKYFEEMLALFRKYNFKTMILTNGTPLTKNKVDIIEKYQDVVYGICLNIPSSDPESWSRYVGMNEKIFDKVLGNISYAIEKLPNMYKQKQISVQINGVNNSSLFKNGGMIDLLDNSPEYNLDESNGDLIGHKENFERMFPGINAYIMPGLVDRAGHLDSLNVMTNINGINKKRDESNLKKVVGCLNGSDGGRTESWLHINANGDVFICCNDYDFETIFGNINDKSIKEIWLGKERQDMIAKSYEDFCTTCSFAVWA
jgi:radical SAM protein with 4Fe4S-binding SPASM domain